ncbi:MAG: hypothetical protein ACTSUK_07215 [Promethearchaeota archaeon]
MNKTDIIAYLNFVKSNISKAEERRYSPFVEELEDEDVEEISVLIWLKSFDDDLGACVINDISETAIIITELEWEADGQRVLNPTSVYIIDLADIRKIQVEY